jgi:hypothetical protein
VIPVCEICGTSKTHEVDASRIISGASVQLDGQNEDWAVEARIDALNQTDIGLGDNETKTSLSTAYLNVEHKDSSVVARLGRQSRNDAGIFGRFDGVWLGFEAGKQVDFGLAAGSPVYFRDQLPFEDDVFFLSARATYNVPKSHWFADVYAIEQRAGRIVDRRAIGAELRYETRYLAAYVGGDFDIYQRKASGAYVSANWQMNDWVGLNASLDYRTTPFLLTSNALSGQNENKLPSLVRLLGESQVLSLAEDRTADAITATLGASYRLSDQWQLSFDALWMDVSGTPESGGVSEVNSAGADIYASVYAYGSGIFDLADSGGAGMSVMHNDRLSRITADVFWRYPLNDNLLLSPRIKTSVRISDSEISLKIMPSIGARYRVSKNWLLESEFGLTFDSQDNETEIQSLIGYRYEF